MSYQHIVNATRMKVWDAFTMTYVGHWRCVWYAGVSVMVTIQGLAYYDVDALDPWVKTAALAAANLPPDYNASNIIVEVVPTAKHHLFRRSMLADDATLNTVLRLTFIPYGPVDVNVLEQQLLATGSTFTALFRNNLPYFIAPTGGFVVSSALVACEQRAESKML